MLHPRRSSRLIVACDSHLGRRTRAQSSFLLGRWSRIVVECEFSSSPPHAAQVQVSERASGHKRETRSLSPRLAGANYLAGRSQSRIQRRMKQPLGGCIQIGPASLIWRLIAAPGRLSHPGSRAPNEVATRSPDHESARLVSWLVGQPGSESLAALKLNLEHRS